jgi:Apea-like HEPN
LPQARSSSAPEASPSDLALSIPSEHLLGASGGLKMEDETIVAVRFPRLYRAVRRFVSEALDLIRTRVGTPDNWPPNWFQEITFSGEGRSRREYVQKIDVGEVIRRIWPEVAVFQSYKAVCQELEKLGASGQFGDVGPSHLGWFMTQYITGPNADFADSRFKGIYDDLEEYLGSDRVKIRAFFQLQHLKGEVSTLDLDRFHSIVKADESLARQIWTRSVGADIPARVGLELSSRFPVTPGEFVLVATFEFEKSESRNLSLFLNSEVSRSTCAFRLAYPGSGAIRFLTYDHVGFFPEFGRLGSRELYPTGAFYYELTPAVGERMSKLWPNAFELSEQLEADAKQVPPPIRIGVGRYVGSFAEKLPDDRLLDYVIGLEALCGRENDSISYRVPLRVSTLIARDSKEREKLFDLVSEGYAERSKVAHGKGTLTVPLDASREKWLLDLQTTLFRTIHTYIRARQNSLNKEQLIGLLDSAIRTQDRTVLESKIFPEYL